MRQSAHSLRLAVSLLLGAVFVVTPVVSTTYAAGSDPLLTSPVLLAQTSDHTLCKTTISGSLNELYSVITPPRFERVNATGINGVIITQAKDSVVQSIAPSKTVLQKATGDDLKEDIPVIPTPTVEITPIAQQIAGTSGTTTPVTPSGVLNAEVLFNLVNATRAQYGLAPFQKDSRLCAVAESRAPEIDSEIWVSHTMHAGFYARNLPYWATENVISMKTEQEALNWWMNSPVHRSALLGNYKFACTACAGKSCSMIFTNFDPKQQVPVAQPVTPTPASAVGTALPVATK